MNDNRLVTELINKNYFREAISIIKRHWMSSYLITENTIQNDYGLSRQEVMELKNSLNSIVYPNSNTQQFLKAEVDKKVTYIKIKRFKLSS